MIRWLFKIVIFLVLAGLLYGIYLLYQEKTPREKEELRASVRAKARHAGRLVEKAGARTIEKVKEISSEPRK